MKKETLIAIILGVVAGIGVAVIMVQKARETQMLSSKSIATAVQLSPSVPVKNNSFQALEITQPDNNSISSNKSIDIKGKVNPGSLVVIQSPINQDAVKADKGDFTFSAYPLAIGENSIRISVYSKDPQIPTQEKELKIYYLDEQ